MTTNNYYIPIIEETLEYFKKNEDTTNKKFSLNKIMIVIKEIDI